ncbi:hypothetical protein [Halolamina salifodinae]|uniref:Uncharacterized protein n=1 Tax=Halolamina salifodinae TaxID=1202767 RepID=A0A8T4H0B3_9EURY|nr:hypothetical protein [Halolamina salifodinae]MBP1988002.1 hypothetical protein [Halolamina salifodinae]
MKRTLVRTLQFVTLGAAALLAVAFRRAKKRAEGTPLSPVTADWYVGPNFVEREGLTTGEEPAGEVADVSHFAGEAFDPDRLHPEVRRFYERTADYEMRYRAQWHRPFRTGAAVASRFTSRIEQLNLPAPGDESWHRLESQFLDIAEPGSVAIDDDTVEPAREDVRAWVRTDPETGDAVFVALYATHHRDGDGFVNISVPVPAGGVDTVLRPENLAVRADNRTGIRLTTEAAGDPRLYLRTPLGSVEVPGGQSFEVWPVDEDEIALRATHEMWLRGATFLNVEYEIQRA